MLWSRPLVLLQNHGEIRVSLFYKMSFVNCAWFVLMWTGYKSCRLNEVQPLDSGLENDCGKKEKGALEQVMGSRKKALHLDLNPTRTSPSPTMNMQTEG